MGANPLSRIREAHDAAVDKLRPAQPEQPRNYDGTAWPPGPVWVGGQPIGLLLALTRPYSAEGQPLGLLLALTKVH